MSWQQRAKTITEQKPNSRLSVRFVDAGPCSISVAFLAVNIAVTIVAESVS